jgi:rhodanese-related sulfurtransferase
LKNFVLILFYLSTWGCFSQKTIPEVLKKYNKETIPYITIENLKDKPEAIFLDTREPKEFDVSHITGAICVGYDQFDPIKTKEILKKKEAIIIVYCSIGIRSEIIGTKLQKLGYKNVYNLYGGIFEWKNRGFLLLDNNDKPTENVHAFSKEWGKYLLKGNKIY